jgi:hypothetical protein
MTKPWTRDEWLVRAAAIATREYLFGYLSRHIPGSAIEALRRMPIQAAMVACVMDGDNVKAAMARKSERVAELEAQLLKNNPLLDEAADALDSAEKYWLTIAIQHLNSSPYNLTKDECIELLRKLRGDDKS